MQYQITTNQIKSQVTKLKNAIGLLHPHSEIVDREEAEHSIKVAEGIMAEVIKFLETREGRN
jgi:hypothetical protein